MKVLLPLANDIQNNVPTVQIDGLSHWFGMGNTRKQVLYSVSMKIDPGEVVLLTGPSGCGKTTLLTLIGALRKVEKGELFVLGHHLRNSSQKTRQILRRNIGMIFQGHNLLR